MEWLGLLFPICVFLHYYFRAPAEKRYPLREDGCVDIAKWREMKRRGQL